MEFKLRGYLEKTIDNQLKESTLKTYFDLNNRFSPIISSNEDMVFGFIIGNTFANYAQVCEELRKGSMKEEDIKLFVEVVERRGLEIKSTIREIGNL
jgi:hypothetical protein